MKMQKLSPDLLLNAYSQGLFPMADSAEAEDVYWYDPEMRGQLPIRHLHISRSLRKKVRKNPYTIVYNMDFSSVIRECGRAMPDRPETWINSDIRAAFEALHRAGYAHSVEAWQNGNLVGGLYGLAIGGAFFGESMFSRRTNASKICLIHLTAHLWRQGFTVFDTQFVNDHLKQFGVYELPRAEYLLRLKNAVMDNVQFVPSDLSSARVLPVETLASFSADSGNIPGPVVSFSSSGTLVESFLQSMIHTS